MLALNASIESACVGDRGRGFAVIAAEIATLAVQTVGVMRNVRAMMAARGLSIDTVPLSVGQI